MNQLGIQVPTVESWHTQCGSDQLSPFYAGETVLATSGCLLGTFLPECLTDEVISSVQENEGECYITTPACSG